MDWKLVVKKVVWGLVLAIIADIGVKLDHMPGLTASVLSLFVWFMFFGTVYIYGYWQKRNP